MQFLGVLACAAVAADGDQAVQVYGAKRGAPPGHEAFMALLGEKGRPMDPMVSSLAAMAESISKQEPGAREESVKSIKTLLTGLLDSITSQHTIAQNSVTNLTAFTTCNVNKAADLAHAGTVKKVSNWTDTSAAYNACIAELEAYNSSYTSCAAQEKMLDVAATARCEYFEAVDRTENFQSWFCHEDDYPATASYESYLQRNIDMLADFRLRRSNCSNATSAHGVKQTECGGKKGLLDAKEVACAALTPSDKPVDCSSYQATKQACVSYSNCWSQAGSESSSAVSTADQLADSLKAQWKALKRIECLLDVILTSSQATALQQCVDQVHDASSLDIAPPAAPAQEVCTAGAAPAGCAA
eukprot:CAMPEP_0181431084 /NCGR_PEP_ID=MMETSP1110-20121109/18061_1 /TAXON_ID=174948 /ORGANISM="Symbiodinium sp., Strain CCMP421" /LENGTH=356 /DNA_ID=CAMNT_0023554429 /DNA_START=34 /DNA_END=1105 /DNA_ORIENTATION=+